MWVKSHCKHQLIAISAETVSDSVPVPQPWPASSGALQALLITLVSEYRGSCDEGGALSTTPPRPRLVPPRRSDLYKHREHPESAV